MMDSELTAFEVPHGLYTTLHLEVWDGATRVVTMDKQEDMSTHGLALLIWAAAWTAGTSMVNTAGATIPASSIPYVMTTSGTLNLAIGIGTNAAAYSDTALGTAQATISLSGGQGVNYSTLNSTVNTWQCFGNWTNNTASAVVISEAALYWYSGATSSTLIGTVGVGPWGTSAVQYYFMLTHDVFTGVTVPKNAVCFLTMTFTFT